MRRPDVEQRRGADTRERTEHDAAADAGAAGANTTAGGHGKSERTGAPADRSERYDGDAGTAAGAWSQADGAAVSAPDGQGLHGADSVLAESVQGLHPDELSRAAAEQHARSA